MLSKTKNRLQILPFSCILSNTLFLKEAIRICKIGILCAGVQEAEPFFSLLQSPRISQKAMLSIHEGTMEIAVLYSGVCKVNAAVATQILIDTYGCAAIINAGTAGGIDLSLSVLIRLFPPKPLIGLWSRIF
ncbi:MAG: hypothetical protein ACLU62_04260 [Hydrogeniiclostridium sp.]